MTRIETKRSGSISTIPFIYGATGEHLVLILVTESRVNRSGRPYTRRLSVTLTVTEFNRLAQGTAGDITLEASR